MVRAVAIAVLSGLIAAGSAVAGLVIQERSAGPDGQGASRTLLFHKNRVKIVDQQATTFLDLGKGRIDIVAPDRKVHWGGTLQEYASRGAGMDWGQEGYYEQYDGYEQQSDYDQNQGYGQQGGYGGEDYDQQGGYGAGTSVTVRVAPQSSTVAGLQCRKHGVFMGGEMMAELCISEQVNLGSEIDVVKYLEFQGQSGDMVWTLCGESQELRSALSRGYPLRTVIPYGPQETFVTEVTKVEKRAIPDAEFAVPQGFKQVSLADLFGTERMGGPDGMGMAEPYGTQGYPGQQGMQQESYGTDPYGGQYQQDDQYQQHNHYQNEDYQLSQQQPQGTAHGQTNQQRNMPGGGTPASGGGKFPHPEGLFTVSHSSEWQPRSMPFGEGTMYLLQHTRQQYTVVLMASQPMMRGQEQGFTQIVMGRLIPQMFPGARPLGKSTNIGCCSGKSVRASYQDLGFSDNGMEFVIRVYLAFDQHVAIWMVARARANEFTSISPEADRIFQTTQMTPINTSAMQMFVGRWQGVSSTQQRQMTFWDGSGNQISGAGGPVSTEYTYVFYPDGRCESNCFTGGSAGEEWGLPGQAAGGAGSSGGGAYFVAGSNVYVVGPDWGYYVLDASQQGVLIEGNITYIRQ